MRPIVEIDLLIVLDPQCDLPDIIDVIEVMKAVGIRELSYRLDQSHWNGDPLWLMRCINWIIAFEEEMTEKDMRFGGLFMALRSQLKRLKPAPGQPFVDFVSLQLSRITAEARALYPDGNEVAKFEAIGSVYQPFSASPNFIPKMTQKLVSRVLRHQPRLMEEYWSIYLTTGFGPLAFERHENGASWVDQECPIGASKLFKSAISAGC
ncbi:MAG: hypothetical protein AAF197_08685 [Pseudomonadota bacterium]